MGWEERTNDDEQGLEGIGSPTTQTIPHHRTTQGDLPCASLDANDPALARSLLGPLRVETPGSNKSSSSSSSPTTTLVLPLRSSAFLRLVVHGCARYYGLKSRSEDEGGHGEEEPCRAVLVTRSVSADVGGGGNLDMTMRAFIRHSRLEQGRLKAGSKGRRLGGGEEGGAPATAAATAEM